MKRRKVFLLTALFALLVFTSCKKEEEDMQEDSKQVVFQVETFEDQSMSYFKDSQINNGEPVSISMWVNEDWYDSYKFLVDEYIKYRPNVEISLTKIPWKSYWIKMRIAMQDGKGPDVFHMHNCFAQDFLPYMQPLSKNLLKEEEIKAVFSNQEQTLIEGERYFFNLGSSTSGIFYNKTLWKQAGLSEKDIPVTWEELNEIAKKLTRYDAAGNIIVDGFNFNESTQELLVAMQLQRGIPAFDVDGKTGNLSSPANLKNVSFLKQMYENDKIYRINEAPATEMFGKQKAAMIYAWSWAANDLERNYPNTDYGFFCLPTWDGNIPPAYDYNNYECSIAVNRNTGDIEKQVGEDFLLFSLCNNEVLLTIMEQAQIVPSKISLQRNELDKLGIVIQEQAKYIERTVFRGILPEAVFAYTKLIMTDLIESGSSLELLRHGEREIGKILETYELPTYLKDYKYYDEMKKEDLME